MNLKNISLKRLFLENIGTRQTIYKNVFWLVGTQLAVSLTSVALLVLAVRVLGVAEYGKFAYALAFVSITACIVDFGVASITVRELAKEKEREEEFSLYLSFKLALCVCFFAVTFLGSFFITHDPFVRQIVWIMSLFVCTESIFQMVYALFHSRQKMEIEALIHIAQTFGIVGAGAAILFFIPTALNLSWGYLLGSALVLAPVVVYMHFFVMRLRWSFNKAVWLNIFHMSWPLVFNFVAGWMYLSVDAFMIGLLGNSQDVGLFSVPSKVIALLIILASLVCRGFYPALSKSLHESKEKLQQIWDYNMKVMIALALPLAAGGIMFGQQIIHLFYGAEYSPSVQVFQILILLGSITFLAYPYSVVLAVCNRQKSNFWVIVFGFAFNAALNVVLFSWWGINGVAWATVITAVVVGALTMVLVRRFTSVVPVNKELGKMTLAGTIATIVTFAFMALPIISHLSIIIVVPLAAVAYGSCLLAIGILGKKYFTINIF